MSRQLLIAILSVFLLAGVPFLVAAPQNDRTSHQVASAHTDCGASVAAMACAIQSSHCTVVFFAGPAYATPEPVNDDKGDYPIPAGSRYQPPVYDVATPPPDVFS